MAVAPIPAGYHSVTPYLILDGAAKAIEFYKKAFDAKELLPSRRPERQDRPRRGEDRRFAGDARPTKWKAIAARRRWAARRSAS